MGQQNNGPRVHQLQASVFLEPRYCFEKTYGMEKITVGYIFGIFCPVMVTRHRPKLICILVWQFYENVIVSNIQRWCSFGPQAEGKNTYLHVCRLQHIEWTCACNVWQTKPIIAELNQHLQTLRGAFSAVSTPFFCNQTFDGILVT